MNKFALDTRIVVIGLGNDLMYDDAVGLQAARMIRPAVAHYADVLESGASGFELLELTEGYDCALLLDAVDMGLRPGSTIIFGLRELRRHECSSPHWLCIAEALDASLALELPLAPDILGFGMQVERSNELHEGLSGRIAAALPAFVAQAVEIVEFWRDFGPSHVRTLRRMAPPTVVCG